MRLPVLILALSATMLFPTAAQASLPPEICGGTVTTAGNGQWVRSGPALSAGALYQLHTGDYIETWGAAGYQGDGVTWRKRTYDYSTPTGEYVPMRNTGTSVVYVQNSFCDRGH